MAATVITAGQGTVTTQATFAAGSVTFATSTGTPGVGDLMVVMMSIRSGAGVPAAVSGWTRYDGLNPTSGQKMYVYLRIRQAGDTNTFSWTASVAGTTNGTAIIQAYYIGGVDDLDPLDIDPVWTYSTGTSATLVGPLTGATSTANQNLALGLFARQDDLGTYTTASSGWTVEQENQNNWLTKASVGTDAAQGLCHKMLPAAGASGTLQVDISGGAVAHWMGCVMIVKQQTGNGLSTVTGEHGADEATVVGQDTTNPPVSIVVGTGTTKYDTAQFPTGHGTRSIRHTVAAQQQRFKINSPRPDDEQFGAAYYRISAFPSTSTRLGSLEAYIGTDLAQWRCSSAGLVNIANNGAAINASTTIGIALNAWFRIEWWFNGAAGTAEVRFFKGADIENAIGAYTDRAQISGLATGEVGRCMFGPGTANFTADIWIRDASIKRTTWVNLPFVGIASPEVATAAVFAYIPTINTASGGSSTTVTPTAATATGAAGDPTVIREARPLPTTAAAAAVANAPTVIREGRALAQNALAAAVANQPTILRAGRPLAEVATATAVANQPTVSTAGATTASAGVATASGTSNQPTITRTGNAPGGVATATAQANSGTARVTASPTHASGAALAHSPIPSARGSAGAAVAVGTGLSATVSTSGATTASAGAAEATGIALPPAVLRAARPLAGAATAAALALNATAIKAVVAVAGAATAAGAANAPTVARAGRPLPTTATATGGALQPQTAIRVSAGVASGVGTAHDPTVSTSGATTASAGVATATGIANQPSKRVMPVPIWASATAKVGKNLMDVNDATLEADPFSWTGANFTDVERNTGEITAREGVYVLKMTKTATSHLNAICVQRNVVPGREYTMAGSLQAFNNVRTGNIIMNWRGPTGSSLALDTTSAGQSLSLGVWKDFVVTGIAPPNAASVWLYLYVSTPTAGDVFYGDRVGFWEGASTDWEAPFGADPQAGVTASAGCATGTGVAQDPTTKVTAGTVIEGQMIRNGLVDTGTDDNFSAGVYDAVDTYDGHGTVRFAAGVTSFSSDDYEPVDPTLNLKLRQVTKTDVAAGLMYWGLAPFDRDFLGIAPRMVWYANNTLTTLAVDLTAGATTVTLTSAANWYNGVSTAQRYIAIWNWVDGAGYAWPPLTYTRTFVGQSPPTSSAEGYPAGGISGNVITLNNTYTGPTIPAGTPVSNNISGGSFKYTSGSGTANLAGVWREVRMLYTGLDTTGKWVADKLPYGTVYVRVIGLNLTNPTGQFWMGESTLVAFGPAPATGAANPAKALIRASAQVATATGTAHQPTVTTAGVTTALAGAATGTAVAQQASVSTTGATNAQAGNAAAAGVGITAQGNVRVAAAAASGTGTAPNPTVVRAGRPLPSSATGSGAAQQATPKITVSAGLAAATGTGNGATTRLVVQPGAATATAQALNATVSTAGITTAQAQPATATGTAHPATILASSRATPSTATATSTAPAPQTAVRPNAGAAAGAGAVSAAQPSVRPQAGAATASGAALAPSIATSSAVSAGCATASGTAHNAVVSTSTAANVQAGLAAAAATAWGTVGRVRPTSGVALAVAAAQQASTLLKATAGVATAAGTVPGAKPGVGTKPDSALALATANTLKAQIAVHAQAAAAHVTAWPPNIVSERLTLQVVVPTTVYRLLVDNFTDGPASGKRRVVTATVNPTSLRRLVDAQGEAVMYEDIELVEGDVLTLQLNLVAKDDDGVVSAFDLTGYSGLTFRCKNTRYDTDPEAFFTAAGAVVGPAANGGVEIVLALAATERPGNFHYSLKGTKTAQPRTLGHGGWIITNV